MRLFHLISICLLDATILRKPQNENVTYVTSSIYNYNYKNTYNSLFYLFGSDKDLHEISQAASRLGAFEAEALKRRVSVSGWRIHNFWPEKTSNMFNEPLF